MDSDMTLCNSPEVDKSSQVQKIAKNFESSLLLGGGEYDHPHSHGYQQHHQPPPSQHPHQQSQYQYQTHTQTSASRLKSLSGYVFSNTKNRVNRTNENENRQPNSRHIKIIKVDPTTFHKKVNKSGMMNQRNIVVGGNHTVTSTPNTNEYYGFNPFADENDSHHSFQLSKSQNYSQPAMATGQIRLFGSDVTNVLNANCQAAPVDKPKQNYPLQSFGDQFGSLAGQSFANVKTHIGYPTQSNVDVYGKSVFRSADVGMYMQHGNMENSCSNLYSDESQEPSQSQGSNEIIFKNYDLTDEYWLNFDQWIRNESN